MKKQLEIIWKNLKVLMHIFVKPKIAFSSIRDNPNLVVAVIIIISIVSIGLYAGRNSPILKSKSVEFVHLYIIVMFIISTTAYLIYLSLKTLIILIISSFPKEKGTFRALFVAFTYCMFPALLGSTIPLIFPQIYPGILYISKVIIFKIWEVALSIVAISVLFNFTYKKSLLVYLPWGVIEILIYLSGKIFKNM